MQQKETKAPIKNEASNGLHNVRGTCPWPAPPTRFGHQPVLHQRGRQRFPPGRDAGYAVFGKVVKGMDVVDIIVNSQTTTKRACRRAGRPGVIKSAKRID
jgi:peptidyl-prolyl cis-trans isomerase A (cyclophilin A)